MSGRDIGRSLLHVAGLAGPELDPGFLAERLLEQLDDVQDVLAPRRAEIVEAVPRFGRRPVEDGERARHDVVDVAEVAPDEAQVIEVDGQAPVDRLCGEYRPP